MALTTTDTGAPTLGKRGRRKCVKCGAVANRIVHISMNGPGQMPQALCAKCGGKMVKVSRGS